MNLFEQGFMDKCAEAGMDAQQLIKMGINASRIKSPTKDWVGVAKGIAKRFNGPVEMPAAISPYISIRMADGEVKRLPMQVVKDIVTKKPVTPPVNPFPQMQQTGKALFGGTEHSLRGLSNYFDKIKPAVTKQGESDMDTFEQGFMDKCAELGVDPAGIIKFARTAAVKQVAKQVAKKAPSVAKKVKGFGAQISDKWNKLKPGMRTGIIAGTSAGVAGAGAGTAGYLAGRATKSEVKKANQTLFDQGFMDKCAELGVDADELIKYAQ